MITVTPDIQYQPLQVSADAVPAVRYGSEVDNERRMREIDQRQKEAGQVIGRFVTLDDGPSTSTYQITQVTQYTATIRYCPGLPENHPHPAIGQWATLERAHVQAMVDQHDAEAQAEAEARQNGWY